MNKRDLLDAFEGIRPSAELKQRILREGEKTVQGKRTTGRRRVLRYASGAVAAALVIAVGARVISFLPGLDGGTPEEGLTAGASSGSYELAAKSGDAMNAAGIMAPAALDSSMPDPFGGAEVNQAFYDWEEAPALTGSGSVSRTPEWIYYGTPAQYAEEKLDAVTLLRLLPVYEDMGLTEDALDALADKLLQYVDDTDPDMEPVMVQGGAYIYDPGDSYFSASAQLLEFPTDALPQVLVYQLEAHTQVLSVGNGGDSASMYALDGLLVRAAKLDAGISYDTEQGRDFDLAIATTEEVTLLRAGDSGSLPLRMKDGFYPGKGAAAVTIALPETVKVRIAAAGASVFGLDVDPQSGVIVTSSSEGVYVTNLVDGASRKVLSQPAGDVGAGMYTEPRLLVGGTKVAFKVTDDSQAGYKAIALLDIATGKVTTYEDVFPGRYAWVQYPSDTQIVVLGNLEGEIESDDAYCLTIDAVTGERTGSQVPYTLAAADGSFVKLEAWYGTRGRSADGYEDGDDPTVRKLYAVTRWSADGTESVKTVVCAKYLGLSYIGENYALGLADGRLAAVLSLGA